MVGSDQYLFYKHGLHVSFSKSGKSKEACKPYSITLHNAGKGWIHLKRCGVLLLGQVNSLPVVTLLEAERAKSTHHDTAQFIGCQNATCLLTQLI